jgi:hypothetical protein
LSLDLYRFSFKDVFYPQQGTIFAPQQGTIFAPQSGAFFAIGEERSLRSARSILCDRRAAFFAIGEERSLRSITNKSHAKLIRSYSFFSKTNSPIISKSGAI